MAKEKTVVRVLVDAPIGGKQYKCNSLVSLPVELAKAAVKDGVADDSKAGIDYVQSGGGKVVDHEAKDEATKEEGAK